RRVGDEVAAGLDELQAVQQRGRKLEDMLQTAAVKDDIVGFAPVGRDGLVEIVKPVCALVVCRVEAVYRGRSEGTEERLRVRAVKTIQRGPGGGQRLPSPRQHALPFAAADEEVLTADHQRAVKLH